MHNQGLSLLEVLIALLLISGASLVFLHQQWQIQRVINESLQRSITNQQQNNLAESGVKLID